MEYALIFIILVAVELLYFRVAARLGIVDIPNERSSHSRVTLRGGGIVFLAAAWLYAAFFGIGYPWFMAGLTLIAVISFADDISSVSGRLRIAVHAVAMGLMFCQWGFFTVYPWWYAVPALILCTGIINAFNFMDGINGITAGYSLAVLLPLAYINLYLTPFVSQELVYVSIISVLVFSFFNFRKRAVCFAGDVGAVSMAFIILFMLGNLILATGDASYIILLAVYGVDSVLTIVRRLIKGENIFTAHRSHLYQLMANRLKMPHTLVSGIYSLGQLALTSVFLLLPHARWPVFGITVVLLAGIYQLSVKKIMNIKPLADDRTKA